MTPLVSRVTPLNDFVIEMQTSDIFVLLDNLQVLRDFRHVNPDGDEEAKEICYQLYTRLQHLNVRWALFQNSLLLNVAACYQKLREYIKSIETCNKASSLGSP
jgi:hypothetical protein